MLATVLHIKWVLMYLVCTLFVHKLPYTCLSTKVQLTTIWLRWANLLMFASRSHTRSNLIGVFLISLSSRHGGLLAAGPRSHYNYTHNYSNESTKMN